MRSRFVSIGLILFCLAALVHAATKPSTSGNRPTPRPLAYHASVVIAKPRAAYADTIDRSEAAEHIHVRNRFERLGGLRTIQVNAGESVPAAIARLQATGRYEFVEPDYMLHQDATPTDPYFSYQWSLNNTAQLTGGTAGADIHALTAWDIIHDAPNVIVAVVDGGVRLDHHDIVGNLWRNPSPTFGDVNGASFINGVQGIDLSDVNGHGTHIAGIICASADNNYGIAGVVWRTQLMVLKNTAKADGYSYASDNAACINYAVAHGANIINCSFGGPSFSHALYTAIQAARDAGVIVVCSAGNDATDNDLTQVYPANYLVDNVVTVGNSTASDASASSSNYGNVVDLFAPGSSILSLDFSSTTGVIYMSGTSMSAPHVTGALALLKAEFPTDSYRQLINRLLRGAEYKSGLSGRCATNGRLNLYNALTTTTNRPFNDDLLGRSIITGSYFSIRANTTGATVEPTEPAHVGNGTRTLWWEWIAPATGTVVFDTTGSGVDTTLDVYTGSGSATTFSELTPLVSNDDNGASTNSRVTFATTAYATYFVCVGAKSDGYVQLNVAVPAPNDNFANAQPFSGESDYAWVYNITATVEPGEPQILNQNGDASVWYKWTAPRDGQFQVSAFSYDFDALLAVYTGTALDNLTLVAADDDTDPSSTIHNTDSRCTISAKSGTTYYIQVETKSTGQRGEVTTSITDSLWQLSNDGGSFTSAPAVGPDGTLYIGAKYPDHRLYAVAPNGTLKWSYDMTGGVDVAAPAIGSDGTIYQGSTAGNVVALNPDGTVRWHIDLGTNNDASYSMAIGTDGTLYTHAGDGDLYAINGADGSIKWHFPAHATTYGSASIAPDGTIYQQSDGDKALYAVNPDGTQKWKYDVGGIVYSVPAIDGSGNLYFADYTNAKVISLTASGALRWTYTGMSTGASSSPALSADGSTVYIGGGDQKLHAIDASTGNVRWTYPCGDAMYASSPAVDANGVIYIGAYDGKVYAINPTGTLKRTWDTAIGIRSSPTISGTTLYIGSGDAKLYAFDIGATLAGGPWPQYRQNAHMTGRVEVAPVEITTEPQSESVSVGAALNLQVAATGEAPLKYQWYKDGTAIAGATTSSYSISSVSAADAGNYTVVVSGPSGTVTSNAATVSFGPTAWLSNLSIRANMASGQTMIVGFTVAGGAESILMRADGPALASVFPQYFSASSVMADPRLAFYPQGASTPALTNDNWDASLATTFSSVGAFPFDAGSTDAAFVHNIDGPNNTVWVQGTGPGYVLVEGYALGSGAAPRLTNISARNHVGTGGDILIAGFVVKGSGSKKLLIRGIGPRLHELFGLNGVLADPKLEIYDGSGTKIAENNDWDSSLSTTFDAVGAYSFTAGSKDAAIVVNLPASAAGTAYSAQVKGNDGGTGEAVVEVYEVP